MSKFHHFFFICWNDIVNVNLLNLFRSIYSWIFHLKLGIPLPMNVPTVQYSTPFAYCSLLNVQYLFGTTFNLVYDRLDYKQTPNGSWEIENREFYFLCSISVCNWCSLLRICEDFNNKRENTPSAQRGNEKRQ